MRYDKPPLGVFPRWLWLEYLEVPAEPSKEEKKQREVALSAAIKRRTDAGWIPLRCWFDELLLL